MHGLWIAAGLLTLAGCTLNDPPADDGPKTTAEMARFASDEELVEYFRAEVVRRNSEYADYGRGVEDGDGPIEDSGDGASPEAPSGNDSGLGDGEGSDEDFGFSGTTLQEQGVDESDVIKTDGAHLYLIDDSQFDHSIVRIVSMEDPANMAVVASVELTGAGRDLYLIGDRLVALTATYGGFYYSDGFAIGGPDIAFGEMGIEPGPGIIPELERPKTIVSVIDITERNNPTIETEASFEGNAVSSRMIDGVLHLVVANYPQFYFDILPLGTDDVASVELTADALLPDFETVGPDGETRSGDVVSAGAVYHPVAEDGFGIVTLISMDVTAGGEFTSLGVLAQPGLVYASTDAIYLTDTQYDFTGELRETTNLYKFALGEDGVALTASGQVPGRVLNQYSMSEFEARLRIATTVGPIFDENGVSQSSNNVYVLEQVDDALNVVGSIEGIAPGETIQAARFVGNRGFVVTFEQIDPLFTLDLSEPTNPVVVGELKVPGFSTYIVPMDENHLLTVGQHIPENSFSLGVQLSIFDITDFADPQLLHNEVVGEGDAWSEALWNPKAFTWFAQRGLVAVPVTIYGGFDGGFEEGDEGGGDGGFEVPPYEGGDFPMEDPDGDGPSGPPMEDPDGQGEEPFDPPFIDPFPFDPDYFEGVAFYRVSTEAGFESLGRISTQTVSLFQYTSFMRGLFIGDNAFAVSNQVIRGAPLDGIEEAPYELYLVEPPSERPIPEIELLIEMLIREYGFEIGDEGDVEILRAELAILLEEYILQQYGGDYEGNLEDLPPEFWEMLFRHFGQMPPGDR